MTVSAISMSDFFLRAGDFLFHTIEKEGETPRAKYSAHFHYTHGTAVFDGAEWKYFLNPNKWN